MRTLVPAALVVLAAALALAGAPGDAWAQGGACVDLCSASCIKPFSLPDRWDDVSGIPGYMGEGSGRARRPDWRNNQAYDRESFSDADGNRQWGPGESFTDGNGNGSYDTETYHPALTGYSAHPVPGNFLSPDGDLGLELILHPGYTTTPPVPGQYLSFSLPPVNKGTPISGGSEYRENISRCNPALVEPGDWLQVEAGSMVGPTNQGMRDIVAMDPNAEWDDATQAVVNSDFELSPRVLFLAAYDPRLPVVSGSNTIQVTKVIAFFMERMVGPAQVRGRFLRAFTPGVALGAPCAPGQVGGFIVDCPVPASATSWGLVKATYR